MKTETLDECVKLIPDEGKVIECMIDGRHYSEVVCPENQIKYYTEVEK